MSLITQLNSMQKNYDLQGIFINANINKVFDFISNPENLSKWTKAFSKADKDSAVMSTPKGEINIKLRTQASRDIGNIDWYMTMPDGAVGSAFSRLTPHGQGCVYSFVLMPPAVPVEQIEGTLIEQSGILKEELVMLKDLLENS